MLRFSHGGFGLGWDVAFVVVGEDSVEFVNLVSFEIGREESCGFNGPNCSKVAI
jgi:hypothetical protein